MFQEEEDDEEGEEKRSRKKRKKKRKGKGAQVAPPTHPSLPLIHQPNILRHLLLLSRQPLDLDLNSTDPTVPLRPTPGLETDTPPRRPQLTNPLELRFSTGAFPQDPRRRRLVATATIRPSCGVACALRPPRRPRIRTGFVPNVVHEVRGAEPGLALSVPDDEGGHGVFIRARPAVLEIDAG